MQTIKQSSTAQALVFLMVDSADHVTGKTGLTPTVTLSKNGGAFGAPSGAVSEISAGWYKVAGNATDSNTLGALALHATSAGADPTDTMYEVVAYDPQAANLGLSDVPVDVVKISGDATAADNLELDYDGTGYAKANSTIGTATSVTNDVGITQAGADKVWTSAARTLTSFGTLIADIWAYSTRSLTTFGTLAADVWASVTRTLTAATNITSDGGTIDQTKIANLDATVSSRSTFNAATDTVANVTTTASVTNDVGITQTGADKVWASAARTLTSFGTLAADVWAVVTRTITGIVGTTLPAVVANDATVSKEATLTPVASNMSSVKTTVESLQVFPKGEAINNFDFVMTNAALVKLTGLTVSGFASKDGAAFVALTNSPAEVGLGHYKVNLTAAEMNYDAITLVFQAVGARDTDIRIMTQR